MSSEILSTVSSFGNVTDSGENFTDEYFYDYDASFTIAAEELVPVALVYGITLILGIIGNSLVILSVTRYRRMNNITNTFLLGLATADLLLVLTCVPIKLASFLTFTWQFGEILCKVVYYFQNVSAICSVTTLTTMSMERYYAILHPIKAKYKCTKGRARRAIVGIWLLSFVLAAPVLHVRMLREVGHYRKSYWCQKQFAQAIYHQLYEIYMACILLLIPVTVMSFAYISICKELWAMTFRRSEMRAGGIKIEKFDRRRKKNSYIPPLTETSPVLRKSGFKYSSEDDKTRKQVIKMLVSVIVLFVLCWAPILVNNVLVSFSVLSELNRGYLKPMRKAFYILAYGNSCVNPIVYGFMSKNFRETFKHALCSCVRGWSFVRRKQFSRQSSVQSKTTHLELTGISRTDFKPHVSAADVNHELRDDAVYDSDGPIVEYL